ncbi:MAG TPA: hypothetical protein VFQ13_19980 [Anaerolineales bacterium]|nr:hypothetical protein [Anaerolineales bacterium]
MLDKDPYHAQALDLALIVIGGIRTTQLQAQEPLTTAYLLDRRLDPIVTMCSRCRKSWIGGDPLLMPGMQLFASFVSINSGAPRPMQCYHCGYVLCSECITDIMAGDPLAPGTLPTKCPVCGANELKRPAYPTGRPPQQMARHAEPVVQVIVFREGPVPPDNAFLKSFIEQFSPDAIEDQAKLVGVPLFPWPADVETVARNKLAEKEASGEILAGSVETAHAMDDQGNRLYVIKLMRPAHKQGQERAAAEGRSVLGQWKEAIGRWFSPVRSSVLDRLVEDLMRKHVARITDHPAFKSDANVVAFYRSLLSPAPLLFAQKTIAANLQAVFDGDQQYTEAQWIGDTFVMISIAPRLAPTSARGYFQGGYLKFLDVQLQQAGVQIGTTNIAHWIYCTDGKEAGVHLTAFPRVGQRMVALDLLTNMERSQIGL